MMAHRFEAPYVCSSGVRWEPTAYNHIDQTPYLAYLEKEEETVRATQRGLDRDSQK